MLTQLNPRPVKAKIVEMKTNIHAIVEIADAKYVEDFKIAITFSDGKKHIVDFAPFLTGSLHAEIRKYLNVKKFLQYTIKDGELMWGDFDMIFPIAELYQKTVIE